MASEEQQTQDGIDFEKKVARAKKLKEDLDNEEGWTQRHHVENEFNSWSKTFTDEEVPIKIFAKIENLPMSAEKFAEMIHPSKTDLRKKWDKTYAETEILETLPDGSVICYVPVRLSFPLSDRDVVLRIFPPGELDWFGKKAYAVFNENAIHESKPAGIKGFTRATNGGNFYIAVVDGEEPESNCEVFILSNNNLNGWLPSKEFVGGKVSKALYEFRASAIEGHKKHFS